MSVFHFHNLQIHTEMQIKGKERWWGFYSLRLVKSQRKCNCLKVVLMLVSRQSMFQNCPILTVLLINNFKNRREDKWWQRLKMVKSSAFQEGGKYTFWKSQTTKLETDQEESRMDY